MKTYIALFQGPNAREARPLLATSDKELVRHFARLLQQRLAGPTGKTEDVDNTEKNRAGGRQ